MQIHVAAVSQYQTEFSGSFTWYATLPRDPSSSAIILSYSWQIVMRWNTYSTGHVVIQDRRVVSDSKCFLHKRLALRELLIIRPLTYMDTGYRRCSARHLWKPLLSDIQTLPPISFFWQNTSVLIYRVTQRLAPGSMVPLNVLIIAHHIANAMHA